MGLRALDAVHQRAQHDLLADVLLVRGFDDVLGAMLRIRVSRLPLADFRLPKRHAVLEKNCFSRTLFVYQFYPKIAVSASSASFGVSAR